MYVIEFPFNRLNSTAYYRTKNYNTFLEVLRKEKTFKKTLAKRSLSSNVTGLQFIISGLTKKTL